VAVAFVDPQGAPWDILTVSVLRGQRHIGTEDVSRFAAINFGDNAFSGRHVTAGPLVETVSRRPAIESEVEWDGAGSGGDVRAHFLYVFAGTTWYRVECGYVREHEETMDAGCAKVLSTFVLL
jgi:hypothetical protein